MQIRATRQRFQGFRVTVRIRHRSALHTSSKRGESFANLTTRATPEEEVAAVSTSVTLSNATRLDGVTHLSDAENVQPKNSGRQKRSRTSAYPGTSKKGNRWYYYLRVEGRKVWEGSFTTQREAGEARTAALARRDQGVYAPKSPVTVAQYFDEWLPTLEAHLKPTTVHQYRQKSQYSIDALGDKPLQKVRAIDVEKMQQGLLKRGLSPRSVAMATQTLGAMFKHARDIGEVVQTNPVEKVRKPRQTKPKTKGALSGEQVARILVASTGTQWEAYIRLAIFTGARRGELTALRWRDIDWKSGTLRIASNIVATTDGLIEQSPKGGNSRVVTLDPETLMVLKTHRAKQNEQRLELGPYWLGDQDWITASPEGVGFTPNAATRAWNAACKRAGVKGFRLHDARHTHATHLLASGVPLHVVAARLGHKDAMVTATIYAHVLDEQAVDAADAFAKAMQA